MMGGDYVLIKEILETHNREYLFENSIGKFEVSSGLAKYNFLQRKYDAIGKVCAKKYVDAMFGQNSSCDEFIDKHNQYFISALDVGLDEAKRDLMSMGILNVDEEALYEFLKGFGYLNDYLTIENSFMEEVNAVYEDLEYKKLAREERKDNRARWVGGSYSSRPNYIDEYMHQAELGARNAIEGAGHSLINAVGNMASKASANAKLGNLYRNEEVRQKFELGVERANSNLKFAVKNFLQNRLGIDDWKIPTKNECIMAKRLRNNYYTSGLSEEQRKEMLIQSFNLNPFNRELYSIMLENYLSESASITQIAGFFGVKLDDEKDKITLEFLSKIIGNSEEEAKKAKEELLKFYKKIGIDNYEELESYKKIQSILAEYDLKARTVEDEVFNTREEAEIARRELPEIRKLMENIKPPTTNSTLEYEYNLIQIKEEINTNFSSRFKDKYISKINIYLKDFDDKFCTISMFRKGTRKEAAKVKALNYVKKQKTDTAVDREIALDKLRAYLPKIGLMEQEATEALEYLKKKEKEELYGKESIMSKISKGINDFFK